MISLISLEMMSGLIAQEIEKVLPEAVITRDSGYLAVDYHKIVPITCRGN